MRTQPVLHADALAYAQAVIAQHAAVPFADVNAVSGWMHDAWNNPRLVIRTDAEGKSITVTYRERKAVDATSVLLFTIHIN